MALFTYIAYNKKGKQVKGIEDATNEQAARAKLKAKGLHVKTIKADIEKKEREMFPWLAKLFYRIPRKQIGLFVRQLGTLLGAGIPLDRSMSNIIEQTENKHLKKVLIEMKTAITEGDTLSGAMKKHPTIFPEQYPSLISVGEKTGEYESTLIRLAELEEASAELKSKVQVAMVYPFIMGSLSIAVTIFLLTVVIPQIQELFAQFDRDDLPRITKFVIALSNFLINYGMITLPAIIGSIIFFRFWKNSEKGKPKWDAFVLKIPIFGTLARKVLISSFSRNMGVLLMNRVPLITSLQITSNIVSNYIFKKEILDVVSRIKEGGKIAESFQGSVILTPMVLGMLSAGEASDTIPQMMEKLASIFDEEVNNAIKSMTQSLEPMMMIVMGGLIFTIMAAIMTPMYKLTQNLDKL